MVVKFPPKQISRMIPYHLLCGIEEDSRNHLFFCCHTLGKQNIALGLLGSDFVGLLNSTRPKYNLFVIRYAFQSAVYHLWRERNRRRHGGEAASPTRTLIKQIDKNIRNRINSIWFKGVYLEAIYGVLARDPQSNFPF